MLLSAMMPVHNAEKFVADAITTVLHQTFSDWELVIVDDGSTDDSYEICSEFSKKDDRISVYKYPHSGTGSARNRCLNHISGDVVVICDADDLFFPERFEVHADHFRGNKTLGISSSSSNIIFSDLVSIDEMFYLRFPADPVLIKLRFSKNKMAFNNPGSAIAKWVFDKYGGYDVRLLRAQDYGFFRRTVLDLDISCTDVPMVMYRPNPITLSNWSFFWKNSQYHWLANQTYSSPPCVTTQEEGTDILHPPALWYRQLSYLRYLKNLVNWKKRKRDRLSDVDRKRVLDLFSRLGKISDRRSSITEATR